MADEPEGAPTPPETGPEASAPRGAAASPRRGVSPRLVQVGLAAGGLVGIIAVNLVLIDRAPARAAASTAASATATASASAPPPLARGEEVGLQLPDAGAPDAAVTDADGGAAEGEEPPKGEEPAPEKPGKKPAGNTVEKVAARACSTSHVDGLSRQIIAEARCLDANAFSRVPPRRNLVSEGHVFLYLDAPARDHLLKVLDANPNRTMKVHSALRTVAQQYLLSRWGAGKRCGVQLATRPGASNHETGLALDVAAHATWRKALESEGFRWLGASDRVHFDYVGPGATHHDGLDVRAFQRLWNRNHADDTIGETGRYDAATEKRLKKSPAAGFPLGARCGGGHEGPRAGGGAAGPKRGR